MYALHKLHVSRKKYIREFWKSNHVGESRRAEGILVTRQPRPKKIGGKAAGK